MTDQTHLYDPVPTYDNPADITIPDDSSIYTPDVLPAFFAAIRAADAEGVTRLLDANPALAHTADVGIQPLYAATVAGNPYIVALLAQRGAPIDQLSETGDYYDKHKRVPVMRTPLMAAAYQGSLPLVKLLFHDLEADDSVVAPDGAIALRLAVAGRHTEIIALLPSRRTGGWRRFKHSHRKAWRRIKKAGYALYRFSRFIVWDTPKLIIWTIPKFFLWDLPREWLPYLADELWDAIKAIPGLMARFGEQLRETIAAIPGAVAQFVKRLPELGRQLWVAITEWVKQVGQFVKRLPELGRRLWVAITEWVKRVGHLLWEWTKQTAQLVWDAIREIPSLCATFLRACWDVIVACSRWIWTLVTKTIPHALAETARFIFRILTSTAKFLWQLLKDIVSLFHTLITAIITRFKAVTLDDVLHALKIVFVSVPKWIFQTIGDIVVAISDGIVWTLQHMGEWVYAFAQFVWELLIWIPKKLGQIAIGCGEIIGAGVREVIWWIDPKWKAPSGNVN